MFHGLELNNKSTKKKKKPKKLDIIITLKYFYLKKYRYDFRNLKTPAYYYYREQYC